MKKNQNQEDKRVQKQVKVQKENQPKQTKRKQSQPAENQPAENQEVFLKQQDSRGLYILKKVMSITVDVVLYPLIMLSLLTSMISITARESTQVRGVFGYSVVTILTGSMKAGGFNEGDVVFLKSEKPESIIDTKVDEEEQVVLGDVIAFYKYTAGAPKKSALSIVQAGQTLPEIDENAEKIYDVSIKDKAIKNKSEVIFHRVIAIYMASDGTYFFETKGDSNSSADSALVNEYLVVGKYIEMPEAVTSALTYMITPDGMFWIIILPLAIMVFLQIIELMTIIFDIATEKKVLEGTLAFDSEESIKAKVGKEMSEYNKIYLYDITSQEQKHRIKEFLWEKGFEKNPKKEARIRSNVDASISLYNENRDKYWEFWIENAKTKSMKARLTKLQRNANIIIKTRILQSKNK